ncbi:MAG: hypothetical protein LAQ69_20200 [Acidobacteriia bacterium]|nr:hypothetical protein [Terriglobia bacterium]
MMPNNVKSEDLSWSYDLRSGWSEVEDVVSAHWPNNTNLEDALKRAGYQSKVVTLGQQDSRVYLEVYIKDAHVPGLRYFISLELSGNGENFYVANFPSLLAFLRDFAPILQASELASADYAGNTILDLVRSYYAGTQTRHL